MPSAAAFSTMLTAFVGSVIGGLSSGTLIAFITGWIAWLSFIRILATGIYEFCLTVKFGTSINAASKAQYSEVHTNGIATSGNTVIASPAVLQHASFNEKVAQLMGEDAPEAVNLGDYLVCEGVSLAAKFAAVMPQREDIYNLIACHNLFEKLQRTACNLHVGVSERYRVKSHDRVLLLYSLHNCILISSALLHVSHINKMLSSRRQL
jgi:hypothetical protein